MFCLIIIIILTVLFVKATNFGWKMPSKQPQNLEKTQIDSNLEKYVRKLSNEIGDRSMFNFDKLEEAAKYITGQLESFGYAVEFQNYIVYGKQVKNIVVTKLGKVKPDNIIIVGAHYDTCFNPGANDNASSVAGLLELARFISTKETNCTIRFIAFVNEEPPFYKTESMGSLVYARTAKEKREDIKAVLILEMIGYYSDRPFSQRYPPLFGLFYPNKANFIAVVGNFNSAWLVREVKNNFKKHSQFPIESVATFGFFAGVDFSDHWSFWKVGLPAVMITDTAFYRYKHYHSSTDTYGKLDYNSTAEVVKGISGVLLELSK